MKILKNVLIMLCYIAMLILVCVFFTGNGSFIYEAF